MFPEAFLDLVRLGRSRLPAATVLHQLHSDVKAEAPNIADEAVPDLQLTLDVGHVHCFDDGRPEDVIVNYAGLLANVHLDDHRRGVHEHLMPGEGDIDWPPVLRALEAVADGRDLPATVELSSEMSMRAQ